MMDTKRQAGTATNPDATRAADGISSDGFEKGGMERPPLFPVFLDLRDRSVLVVGAGPIGWEKAARLLESGARVRIIAPDLDGIPAEALSNPRLETRQGPFGKRDLDGMFLVVAATDDQELQLDIHEAARDAGILCNVVDRPEQCDFTYGAITRRGSLQVAVSTEGKFPILAQRVRDHVATTFPESTAHALDELETARQRLRARSSDYQINRNVLRELLDEQAMDEIRTGNLEALRRRIRRWNSLHSS